MIRLEVKEYCQDCKSFKPDIRKIETRNVFNSRTDTYIRCCNEGWCESIVDYLKQEAAKKEEENAEG